jgi:hypothetical protein
VSRRIGAIGANRHGTVTEWRVEDHSHCG